MEKVMAGQVNRQFHCEDPCALANPRTPRSAWVAREDDDRRFLRLARRRVLARRRRREEWLRERLMAHVAEAIQQGLTSASSAGITKVF